MISDSALRYPVAQQGLKQFGESVREDVKRLSTWLPDKEWRISQTAMSRWERDKTKFWLGQMRKFLKRKNQILYKEKHGTQKHNHNNIKSV